MCKAELKELVNLVDTIVTAEAMADVDVDALTDADIELGAKVVVASGWELSFENVMVIANDIKVNGLDAALDKIAMAKAMVAFLAHKSVD